MHPDTIGFSTIKAANSYERDVRTYVSQRASAIKEKADTLTTAVKVPKASTTNIDAALHDCFKRRSPVRAHDLWAKQEHLAEALETEFAVIEADAIKRHGAKWAADNRLHLMQVHRKKRFAMEGGKVQEQWQDAATKPESQKLDPKDIPTFIIENLPVVNAIGTWWAEKTGSPILIATAARSVANPGLIDVFA